MERGAGQCRGATGSVPPPVPAVKATGMPDVASRPSAEAEAEDARDPRRSCSVGVHAVPSALTVPRIQLQVRGLSWAEDHTQPIWWAGPQPLVDGGSGRGPGARATQVGALGGLAQPPRPAQSGRTAQEGIRICCFSPPHHPTPQWGCPGPFRICFWGNALSHNRGCT